MTSQPPRWFERTFQFGLQPEMILIVADRLRGVPARIEDKVKTLPQETLIKKQGSRWSIQEHIGHLLDLEPLGESRIDDYLQNTPSLRSADPRNRQTKGASHNQALAGKLLEAFRTERSAFVSRLISLDPSILARTAIHPRLKQSMNVVDFAWFIAEHDDHHLAQMELLIPR